MRESLKRASVVLVIFVVVLALAATQTPQEAAQAPYERHVLPLSLEALGISDGIQ